MHSSTSLVAIALSVLAGACSASGAQMNTTPLSHRFASGGLDGLWVAAPEEHPEGEVRAAYLSDEPKADLWMKRGSESTTDDGFPTRVTPRLDYVLRRITPDSTSTFVRASYPSTARK